MFLGIDVGNSTMKIGLSNGDGWLHIWRAESGVCANKEEFQVYMQKLFETADLKPESVSGCMIASVVPAYTGPVREVIGNITGIAPIILDVTMETGLQIETDTPEEIGADLLAGAAGAYRQVNSRCIVIDFGTATTILAIQSQGVIAGAAICAGMRITAQALADSTALLGSIPLSPPHNVLGRNTVEAMQSGLVLGHICMVEGLVSRMVKEIGSAKVVATGGLVETLEPMTDCFDIVDPLLTLNGMKAIAQNRSEN